MHANEIDQKRERRKTLFFWIKELLTGLVCGFRHVRIMYGMGLLKLMKSSPLGVICTHGRCYLLLLLIIIIIKKKNL